MAAAIAIAEAGGIRVERADAVDWLAARLADAAPGPRPRRLPLDLLAVPVARGAGARPGAPRRCGCAGDQRRRRSPGSGWSATAHDPGAAISLTLWPDGDDAAARPRRLSRRLGPVARLGGRADGRLIIRIPADRFAGCERWPRRRLPRHGLRLPGLAHLAVRPPRAGVGKRPTVRPARRSGAPARGQAGAGRACARPGMRAAGRYARRRSDQPDPVSAVLAEELLLARLAVPAGLAARPVVARGSAVVRLAAALAVAAPGLAGALAARRPGAPPRGTPISSAGAYRRRRARSRPRGTRRRPPARPSTPSTAMRIDPDVRTTRSPISNFSIT